MAFFNFPIISSHYDFSFTRSYRYDWFIRGIFFNLLLIFTVETSTGIFLPSTISQKDTVFPPSQISFLGAVKSLVYRTIVSQTSFIPFGSVVISTQTGKLLHVEPVLLPSGDLYLKIFYQNASLFNVQLKDIPKAFSSKFYLAPVGVSARYIEPTPIPQDSSFFYDLLRLSTGISYASSIDPGVEWGLFQIEQVSTPVPWPIKFAYMQPLSPNNSGSINFSWFGFKDLMSELESQVSTMKTLVNNELPGQENNVPHTSTSKSTINKQPENTFGFNTEGDIKKQVGSSNVYPTPPDPSSKQRTEGDTVESTNWTTPGGFGSETWGDLDEELFGDEEEITEADFNFFDDQKEQSSIMHTTIQEEPSTIPTGLSMQTHNSLINPEHPSDPSFYSSNATSKLFPEPDWSFSGEDNQSNPPYHSTLESPKLKKVSITKDILDFQIEQKIKQENVDGVYSNLISTKKRRTSIFSPLKFNSVILDGIDPKYSRGGRFFVSDLESDEDEDEDSNMQTTIKEGGEPEGKNILHQSKSNQDQLIDGLPTPDPLTHVIGTLQDASTPDWLNNGKSSSKRKSDERDLQGNESTGVPTSEWLRLFTVPIISGKEKFSIRAMDLETKIGESSDFEAIVNTMVEQIVWDDELFDDIIPSIIYPEQPDPIIVKLVTSVFPALEKLSLLDAIYISERQPAQTQENNLIKSKSHPGDELTTDQNGSSTPTRIESENGSQPQPEKTENAVTRKSDDELVFSLVPPHFSFIRMDQVLKARSPILRFWKVFGLNPRYGQKNITTIFLHPAGEALEHVSSSFLSMFKSTYESCGLGEVELASFSGFKNGAVPVPYKTNSIDQIMETIKETAGNIGRDVYTAFKDQNIVVLFANPFTSISSLIHLSQAFLQMKHSFLEHVYPSNSTPQISFQVVPLSFFAARDTIVAPSQYKMDRFALNVYDKCLNQGDSIISPLSPLPLRLTCQRRCPAFTLARMPPPRINFKLTDKPSPTLLEEDSFIHIAYSLSEDSKWLTAAWSDQWGEISKVEAFCLLKSGSQPRTFEEVCGEIWQKTLAILTHVPVQWRVALAKLGPMEEEELEMWKRFAASSSKSISVPYFLSVDLNPSLVVTGDVNLFPHGQFQKANTARSRLAKDVTSATPITPQRSVEFESPDTYMLNATPPGIHASEPDKFDVEEITIVDVKNDIYGIIFKNCVSTMTSYMSPTFKPLILGYLLKPGSSGEEQKLFEVTFVHCPTSSIASMKNILLQYRGLASLSSFTGVRNRVDSIAPWHIEAVEKVQRVLIQVT